MNDSKMSILCLTDSTLSLLLDSDNASNNSKEFLEKDNSNAREKNKYRLKYNNAKGNKYYFKSSSYILALIDSYNIISQLCIHSKENKKASLYYVVM